MKISRYNIFIKVSLLIILLLIPNISSADLPFVVKVVYFQPADAPDLSDKTRKVVNDVKTLFADEMDRHGYKRKTFRTEKDLNGDLKVHVVKGRKNANAYNVDDMTGTLRAEFPAHLKTSNNIYLIVVGGLRFIDGTNWTVGIGYALFGGVVGGYAVVASETGLTRSVVRHELLHAFGLYHHEGGKGGKDIIPYEARWLNRHHYFNDIHKISDVPKINKFHQLIAVDNQTIQLKYEVSSRNGLHQCNIVRDDLNAIGYSYLSGEIKKTVELDIDRRKVLGHHKLYFQLMDTQGNYWMQGFNIALPQFVEDKEDNKNHNLGEDDKGGAISVIPYRKLTTLWVKLKTR